MNSSGADAESRQVNRRTLLGGKVSRRSLMTATPLAAMGGIALAGGTLAARQTAVTLRSDTATPHRYPGSPDEVSQSLRFFTPEEARAVEAVAARLILGPVDDPGAVQAGVVRYIDTKLAQFRDADEVDRDGSRSHLNYRVIYHLGAPALDRYAQTRFGSLFHQLRVDRQDDVLRVLGDGGGQTPAAQDLVEQAEQVFGELDPGLFLTTVRTDVIEGMSSDLAYGGFPGTSQPALEHRAHLGH